MREREERREEKRGERKREREREREREGTLSPSLLKDSIPCRSPSQRPPSQVNPRSAPTLTCNGLNRTLIEMFLSLLYK